ncbi:MAG: GNAT family N-acetyltransferase [Gammaproteobacteria bacterium]|nr:GNAT family N-acetyltransferase [Gammaproteobacteria bacterium]NNL99506.1 GNAT family N-acetyltransferase [Gammaproteobacteria bacterium]
MELHRVTTPAQLRAAQLIRRNVFVEEQRIPEELEYDGADEASIHVLASADGEAVATARLTPTGEPGFAVMARVAIVPAWRGSGLGRQVVEALEQYGRETGITDIELHPHHYLERFYSDLGYRCVPGGEHEVGEHQLITMAKQL